MKRETDHLFLSELPYSPPQSKIMVLITFIWVSPRTEVISEDVVVPAEEHHESKEDACHDVEHPQEEEEKVVVQHANILPNSGVEVL